MASNLGARLRDARTARGFSIDEVANSLKLNPRIISALEDEAFDQLPSPTYVRGYLRGYAQLLGLPPQQLIDTFNNLPKAAQRADMTAPAPVREVTSSDTMVKAGTLLVVGLVFGLAALWWNGKDGSTSRRRPPAVASAPVDAGEAQARVSESQNAPATDAVKTPESATPTPSPTPEAVASTSPPAPASIPAAVPVESRPVAVTSPPPLDPNAQRVRLVLHITEDSWADVRDAEQRRLLYQTLAAGRVVTVEGVAPLSVFLGNVEGVSLEFNGKPYDPSPHKRGQVARFTLNASGAN